MSEWGESDNVVTVIDDDDIKEEDLGTDAVQG
jgi:hypothetical protein